MNPVRPLLGALALAGAISAPALAQNAPPAGVTITNPGGSDVSTRVELGLNKSTVVELETPAADVVITNPAIADAVVQTARRIIFRGVEIGQTNAIIFDANGRQLANLDLNVEFKTGELEEMIAKRAQAKKDKDFATADSVRDELMAKGIVLRDSPEGTTWTRQ